MTVSHVVVDGSNLATEGRTLPSLRQLDDAVRAYLAEFSPKTVTVIVDASFPNRIETDERDAFEGALAAGELIAPPAGVIGRGDAFLLQVADRADAVVLSNDSFQEFHGQYSWLFEEGRLVGGKPVPHVGWVFMARSPVRGPLSRKSVSDAKKAAKAASTSGDEPTPTKAARAATPSRRGRGGRGAA
ncbi:MAG: NYN domain-containing protein, partial [Acidimicrobiales bacterium]